MQAQEDRLQRGCPELRNQPQPHCRLLTCEIHCSKDMVGFEKRLNPKFRVRPSDVL